jgi:hypothetical protein
MCMTPTLARWLLCVLIGCVGLAGCGRSQRWPALTEPTTAVVRLDGKPVEGALVMLGPVGKGYASQGTTAADGKATLTTFRRGDGAVAGLYKVIVSSEEVRDNPELKLPDPAIDREAYNLARDKAAAAGKAFYLRRQLLPERYVSFDTSGLEAEIRQGSVNEVVLELSSEAAPPPKKP